jgi:hypothetical protein
MWKVWSNGGCRVGVCSLHCRPPIKFVHSCNSTVTISFATSGLPIQSAHIIGTGKTIEQSVQGSILPSLFHKLLEWSITVYRFFSERIQNDLVVTFTVLLEAYSIFFTVSEADSNASLFSRMGSTEDRESRHSQ